MKPVKAHSNLQISPLVVLAAILSFDRQTNQPGSGGLVLSYERAGQWD